MAKRDPSTWVWKVVCLDMLVLRLGCTPPLAWCQLGLAPALEGKFGSYICLDTGHPGRVPAYCKVLMPVNLTSSHPLPIIVVCILTAAPWRWLSDSRVTARYSRSACTGCWSFRWETLQQKQNISGFLLLQCLCFLCRPGSTPPSSWTTQPEPPSRYRTVQISWACCLVYSLPPPPPVSGAPSKPSTAAPFYFFISTDWLWAPSHSAHPQGSLKEEGLTLTWLLVGCWRDNVDNSRTEFSTVHCNSPEELGCPVASPIK